MDVPANASVKFLVRRLRYADARWEAAMAHKGYRDEPAEDRPFSPEEEIRYWWADTWRNLFHFYEEALYAHPYVRKGLVEGLTTREEVTRYESE